MAGRRIARKKAEGTRKGDCTAPDYVPARMSVSQPSGAGFLVVDMSNPEEVAKYNRDADMAKQDLVPLDTTKFLGFERVEHMPKSSYRDCSMVIIIPTRSPHLHIKVVQAIQGLQWPMNGKRAMFFVTGAEVGKAYDDQVAAILEHPELGKWKYVLTLEDDNVPPPEAPLLLTEAIEAGPFDAVGGLYFLKGDLSMPQCYGDPAEFARTGELDFRPRDVVKAIKQGAIVPCNGIAMGCSLYRMSTFREISRPWFKSSPSGTQDLFFCSKAARAGKRFAVDCRVRVGHLDVSTGVIY